MRCSRAQKQQTTRSHLMASAENLFAAKGCGETSLDGIAEAAGYTRGAFYANFESKEDILLSATEQVFREHMERIEELDPEQEAKAWFAVFPRFGTWFVLAIESWLLTQRSSEARTRLRDLFRRLRGRLGRFLQRSAQLRGKPLPLSPEELSAAMIALRIGLMMQRRLEPRGFPEGTYGRIIAILLGQSVTGARE